MPETPERPDRVAELAAAAASDDLGPEEAEEYAALVAADPSLADEVAAMRAALARLEVLPGWEDPQPSPGLRDAVLGRPAEVSTGPATDRTVGPPARRPAAWLPRAAAAVVLVLGGAAVGALVRGGDDPVDQVAAPGPPGTLGALERIDFTGEPADVDIDAGLVAHTWGTETVLSLDGLPPGERYAVVLRDDDGRPADSGGFVGSQARVDCRLNAALLREDVEAVEIRAADGTVVARSDVPTVGDPER